MTAKAPRKPISLRDYWRTIRTNGVFVLIVVCLTSAALLGLILYAAWVALRQPYTGLGWRPTSGVIYAVDADSPAALSGLRSGDVILALNGQPPAEAVVSYPGISSGDTITLSISRGERRLLLHMQFVPLPSNEGLKRLTPLFISLCFALYGFFVWAHRPYDITVILFLTFIELGAAVLALGIFTALYHTDSYLYFNLCLSFLSAAFIHFHLSFLKPKESRRRRFAVRGLYGFAFAIFLLEWLTPRLGVNTQGYGPQIFFAAAVLIAAALIIHAYRTAATASARRRIRVIVLGTLLAFAPLIMLSILPSILIQSPILPYEAAFPFLLIMPSAYAVAIRQYNILNIDRLVNRAVVFMALLLAVVLTYALVSTGLSYLLPAIWSRRPLTEGIIAILIALPFVSLRGRLQAAADRLFYGGWYDYRSVVSGMSAALSGVSDAESLASLLLGQLVDILRLNGAILLLGNEEGKLVVTKTRGFDVLSFSDLSLTGALAAPLQSADSPLSSFELRDGLESANLTEEELAYLTSPHIHLWVPLVRQGNLQGVLLLGARPGDEPFEPEDRRILGTLANQAGIATENIRLIQVLHHRASEAKKLYSQLLHTREDERKRLARELHDQIIQDLINLHFRLDVDAPRFSSDAAEQSQALRRLVQALIEELRAICTELRPAAIDDLSLSLAVQGYVEEFSQLNGLNIELCLPENGYALTSGLPEHTSLSLFRVLQEGLNNVRRHAHATQIQVNLTVEAGRVILEIRDNGQGFVLPRRLGSFVQQKHFGLVGLQEHVDTVGGELAIQSSPGQGTVLRASVPTVT